MSYSKWMIVVVVVMLATLSAARLDAAVNETSVSLKGCPDMCGSVNIPYPFGIGNNCSFHHNFSITCNDTFSPPKPIYGTNLEIQNIAFLLGQVRMTTFVVRRCFNATGGLLPGTYVKSRTNLNTFTFSSADNILVTTGCDTYGWFYGSQSRNRAFSTGCMSRCDSPEEATDGQCSGGGCCETQIPEGVSHLSISVKSFSNYTNINFTDHNLTRCSSAFVVAKDSFNFSQANLTMSADEMPIKLPAVFNWTIGNETCAAANAKGTCLCCGNQTSTCHDSPNLGGYLCSCSPGYSGNPYLPDGAGCQDIDECSNDATNCAKPATCVNKPGSYHCQCPKGYRGEGTIFDPCLPNHNQTVMNIALGAAGAVIVLLILALFLHWHHGKKQISKMRDTFFRQNGGLILHQRLSEQNSSVDLVKIFTTEDLKIATDDFCEKNIIGRGGFGMVYRGILPNNQIIAIKKSLKVDSSQMEQFINEILVLSQVNNRNVVKLLGCCLETEVPLLVYEFIRNGTLHDHLHDERKASVPLWEARLKIANEVAEVLAYLHTTVSTPIIHRDIKSMNILLDENYVAKVSDFGASRLVPMDQDAVATMVLGTRGYLDPEYMQTGDLNEKSDVYSFGVVLVELLTRRKALSQDKPEKERYLAMYFSSQVKEERVLEIVDEKIRSHGATMEQIMEVAMLARKCLELKGEDRPNMKEVAMELERIRRKVVKTSSHNASCLTLLDEERVVLGSKTEEDGGYYYSEQVLHDSGTEESQGSCLLQLVPLGHDGR